ncbi:MAG: hypothetical protein ACPL5F_09455 [Moorellaceae bacterium]
MKVYYWLRELAHVVCLLPVYGQGTDCGNYTEIWMDDGRKFLVRQRIKTVIKNIAAFMGVDLNQKDAAWGKLGRKHAFPLVLAPYMTLVPVFVRHPRGHDEGATGYIVLQKVEGYQEAEEAEFRSVILLDGGLRLPCLLSFRSLALRIVNGEQVHRLSQTLHEGASGK